MMWPQSTIVLWTPKYYYSLNHPKVLLFFEPQSTIILKTHPKALLFSEPQGTIIFWTHPKVLLFSEPQGSIICRTPRYYYSESKITIILWTQGTIILWPSRVLLFCDPLEYYYSLKPKLKLFSKSTTTYYYSLNPKVLLFSKLHKYFVHIFKNLLWALHVWWANNMH